MDTLVFLFQNLKLNNTKTECMVITGKKTRQGNGVAVHIGGEEILRPVSSVTNLGAALDSELPMVPQVNRVIRTAYFHLRQI